MFRDYYDREWKDKQKYKITLLFFYIIVIFKYSKCIYVKIMAETRQEIKLDAKDKKILYELDMDARQAITKIAKKVKLSREVVAYRIKQMEEKGVIEGYYAVIDTTKLGYIYIRVFIKFQNVDDEKEKEIISFIKKMPFVGWIVCVDGIWDLVTIFLTKNISDFEKTFNEILYSYSRYFKERTISIATKIYHLKHNYLYGTIDDKSTVLGEYHENPAQSMHLKYDEIDIKILGMLSQNAVLSSTEVAKEIKLTTNAVKKRINKLIRDKIILCFRSKLNPKLLGYSWHKVFLHLENLTKEKEQKLISYLKFNQNVVYITRAIGASSLEFEFVAKTHEEFHEMLRQIRCKFFDIIKEYESYIVYNEPYINYLPLN